MSNIEIAKNVFDAEAEAIEHLKTLLTDDFSKAVDLIIGSKGRLVISGMGKSGHIGVKISATLASTGTPSFFMHPAEAIHGDLGMLTKDDILLGISNSGESDEIVRIIPLVKKMGIKLIGMAGNINSTLAKESDYFLNITIEKEACPLQLAPMSSTTCTLAMGDALAAALMQKRNFQPEDFAMFHPGGSLGRKLLTRVKDIMSTKDLPIVTNESNFQEVVTTMTHGRVGLCVVKSGDTIEGIITDGDLRRALESTDKIRFDLTAEEIMTKNPKTIHQESMAIEAEEYMLENKVKDLLVVDASSHLVGVVQFYDTGKMA